MTTVRLVNTNPIGDVDVPILGRSLSSGEVFDAPAEIAGRGPEWRPVVPGEDLVGREVRVVEADGHEVVEVHDLGAGLLSQLGNYALASEVSSDDDGFGSMTVAELQAYADDHEIDLTGATRKGDIVATIRAALLD
jgi:hypothetical protein